MKQCAEVTLISKEIKNWLLKQPEVNEESLTDWLLYQISAKVKNTIQIKFSRRKEAKKTGADWEWWFLFKRINYKMRVQAKKINCEKDYYKGIAYKNKYGLQIEALLRDAILTNSIPFYAFYTSIAEKAMCPKNPFDEGVFIAGANTIHKTFITGGKRKIFPQDLLGISNALSCFFCCPFISYITGLYCFFNNYYTLDTNKREYADSIQKEQKMSNDNLGIYTSLPDYILPLLQPENINLPYYEKEFKGFINNVNSIVICDFRNEEDNLHMDLILDTNQ
jgi:hypothetical protein